MRKKTSISVDEKLWNDFRVYSVKSKKNSSKILEEMIKREIGMKKHA
jgi:hypothetical protein